jgi:hypothetical protein
VDNVGLDKAPIIVIVVRKGDQRRIKRCLLDTFSPSVIFLLSFGLRLTLELIRFAVALKG